MEIGGNVSSFARTDQDSSGNVAASADHLLTIGQRRALRGSDSGGAIYYVSCGEGGPIKIGWASSFGALAERLRGLQTACPYHLVALAVRAGSLADERGLHTRFAQSRLRGEWFLRSPELMQHIGAMKRRRDCRQWIPHMSNFTLPSEIIVRGVRGGPDERRQIAMFGPFSEPKVRVF